jgi:leucine dehydrogenase
MIITEISIDGYEEVVHGVDKKTGLDAYIAIHNTKLGPAVGGCRYYPYKTNDEQLNDTLRLAKGMTYKNALAGLDFGGGKATVNALPEKSPELWQAFAGLVNNLYGKYITSGDIGTTIHDLKEIAKSTNFILGHKSKTDSGVATAYGVFQSIKALIKFLHGTDSLKDKTIAVQGIGKVGKRLIDFCLRDGAKVIATDTNVNVFEEYQYGSLNFANISFVKPNEIYEVESDIFSPCSTGGILNQITIPKLKCAGIAGGANNQLEVDELTELLKEKNIFYVPDYLANCGGVIIVEKSQNKTLIDLNYESPIVKNRLDSIFNTVFKVLYQSAKTDQTTIKICNDLAEKRFL